MEKRFHNFKRPLTSFDEDERLLGLVEPGRYRGYDTFIPSGLTFTLAHDNTGIQKTKQDLTLTDKTGILVTPQGNIIHEDEPVGAPFVVGSNAANSFKRIDLVIYEHEFLASPGGQAGIYSILQGPDGSETEPALTNPEKTIIIGTLEIPANESNLNNAVYTPRLVKGLGNSSFANLDEVNNFSKLNQLSQCANIITTITSLAANRSGASIPSDGNLAILNYATTGFELLNALRLKPEGAGELVIRQYQKGVKILLYCIADTNLGDWRTAPITLAKYNLGFREIEVPSTTAPPGGIWQVKAGDIIEFELVDTGVGTRPHKFIITAHQRNLQRALSSLEGTISNLQNDLQQAWVTVSSIATDYSAGSPIPQVSFNLGSISGTSQKKYVFARGRITRDTPVSLSGTSGVHICTVPAAFFPTDRRYIILHSSTGTPGTNNIAQGYIDNDGKVYLIPSSIVTAFDAGTDSIVFEFNYSL